MLNHLEWLGGNNGINKKAFALRDKMLRESGMYEHYKRDLNIKPMKGGGMVMKIVKPHFNSKGEEILPDEDEDLGHQEASKQWIHRAPLFDIKKKRFIHKLKYLKL